MFLSAIFKVMAMGVSLPKLSLLAIDKGIQLTLALESQNVFPILACPILQVIVKLPGSRILYGKDF